MYVLNLVPPPCSSQAGLNCMFSYFSIIPDPALLVIDAQRGSTMGDVEQSVHVSSVTQSCPTLCDPMNYSTPGLPVHHQLPELTSICVHRVSDAIQPSHYLSPLLLQPSTFPSIGVFSKSQFFASGGQSIGASALILPMNIQD